MLKVMTAWASAANNAGVAADTANLTETVWSKLKDPLLDAATEVCGLSKNHQWRPETWWWNEQVMMLYHRSVHGSKLTRPWRREARCLRPRGWDYLQWCQAFAKHAVWLAKSEAEKRNLPQYPQMVMVCFLHWQTDGVHKPGRCWHSLMMTWVMKAWVQHYEFKWPCNELPELVRKLAEAVFSSGMTPVVTFVVSNSQIKSGGHWDGC